MKRIFALILIPLLLAGCSAAPAAPAAPELLEPVQAQQKTAVVQREDLMKATSLPGNIAVYSEPVAFSVDGTLKTLHVIPGQQVKKGDLLAELDTESLQKQLDSLLEQQEKNSYNNALTNQNLQADIDICQLKITKLEQTQLAALTEKTAALTALQTALEQLNSASAAAIAALEAEIAQLREKLSAAEADSEEANQLRSRISDLEGQIQSKQLEDAALRADTEGQLETLNGQIETLRQQQALEKQLMQLDLQDAQLAKKHAAQTQGLAAKKLAGQIQILREKLALTSVTAHMDGTVVWISNSKRVTAQEPLLYIADPTRHYIRTNELSDYQLTTAEQLYAIAGSERYELTYKPLDPDERIYRALNNIAIYSYYEFQPGTQVPESTNAMVFCVHGYRENALCIPATALYRDSRGAYVFKQENGQRKQTYIKAGISTALRVEVLSGLEEGDVVYVSE